jgi:iron complex outermembrane recepter protein
MRLRKLNSIRSLVKRFTITLSVCVCIAAIEMPAMAQQAPATTAAPEATLQEVIVTGSRIPVPANITATSPITVVTGQDIKLSGYTDTIDMLNSLPQNSINAGNDSGNQSSPLTATGGFATVDLRGLGPQRTLVLVDGRRLGVGDPSTTNSNPAPDIDQIPSQLVERIDVVTGGASATYGSDAIAGVVNFIMKKDFQGIEVDGQYGFSQHGQHNGYIDDLLSHNDPVTGFTATTPPTGSIRDGNKHDLSVIMGSNFADGNGNVTGYFVYHDQAAVPGSARDFSDCELVSNGLTGAAQVTNGDECLGSSNSNIFIPTKGAPGFGNSFTVVGNQFLPWPQAGSSPPGVFNFNGYEYLQREDKRYNGGFFAHDDLNDNIKPYVEFSFMDDKTVAQVAPAGLFQSGNPLTSDGNYLINCSNPLLSAQQAGIICTPAQIAADKLNPGSASADVNIGRRNIEGGGRTSDYEHTNFRFVGGLTGDIAPGFTYDAYASYYYVTAFAANLNYLSYQSIDNALQATTGAKGKPVCVSGGTCVPYNIFQTGGVTPAQLAYLETPGTSDGNNTEEITHADVTGDLSKYGVIAPFAKDGVGINVGAEYRKESVTFSPDGAELSGLLAGFGGASVPTNASYDVGEAFAEFRAPLVQDAPGAYDLTADAGYRWSNYSTAGVTNTYKFEVQYAPIKDARMRFSFDRAVRAPNLVELFNAPSVGGEVSVPSDPCAPNFNASTGTYTAPSASLAQCAHSGVTAAEYGAITNGGTKYTGTIGQCVSGECSQEIEGNPALKPEVATTWSIGLTITPTDLPNFNASIDYFHLHLEGVITSLPIGVILDGCLDDANPFDCKQIVRSSTGSINGSTVANGGYVVQQEMNVGTSIVSGIDLLVNHKYELPSGWGSIVTGFNGSWLQHSTFTPYPGGPSYDCAGLFGSTCSTGLSGSVNPRWRHNLRIGWETPWNVLFSLQWRFIGPTSFDNNSTNPLLAGVEENGADNGPPYYDPYNARIPGYSYLDLAAVWHVQKNIELRAGCNNLLDKDPPVLPEADIAGNGGGANSFPTYDLLGRDIYMAFTAKF